MLERGRLPIHLVGKNSLKIQHLIKGENFVVTIRSILCLHKGVERDIPNGRQGSAQRYHRMHRHAPHSATPDQP